MTLISKSKTWSDDEELTASDLNQGFDDIIDVVNGGLDSTNVTLTTTSMSDAPKAVNRQDNTTNNTVSNQLIQTGWGFIIGNGTALLSEAVTFPVAFDSAPIVMITAGGAKATSAGAPATVDDDPTAGNCCAQASNQSTTGFTAKIHGVNSYTMGSTYNFIYQWVAIGTKSRS